jgi:WD40 repeat protein/tetratricopeptide (TPR) repeat protein
MSQGETVTVQPVALPTEHEPAPRTNAPADYVIERELGRGGMGVVYLARHRKLERGCALKMILSGGHAGAAERQRFETEARAIARLRHPGIVQVFEVGEHNGHPFMALELCEGGSLSQRLREQPPAAEEAARIVRDLAVAMQAAHDTQVIHRDLKPGNVLIAGDGSLKVTDFGLAKRLDEAGQTRTGAVMGTPSYMPPEQARGDSNLGPGVDVYALGAILYECLTGRPPFRGATVLETIQQVLNNEAVPVRHLSPGVPRDLETICHRCLQKEPGKRYASARELADDLGRFLNGEPIRARPVGAAERAVKWARRRPALAALLAVTAGALLAVGIVVAVYSAALFQSNQQFEGKNQELGQANAELTVKTTALTKQTAVAENATKDALEKGLEVQRQVEHLRLILCAGQVQKAITQVENDPRAALDSLLDQRLCLPWLRDFAWGATYRRTQAFRGLPVSAIQGALDLSADGKRLAFWGSRQEVRMLELPSGRDCSPKWNTSRGDDAVGPTVHRAITLSPDGKLLAVGLRRVNEPFGGLGPGGFGPGADRSLGALHLYDATTGEKRKALAQKVGIESVVFSRDGKYLAAAAFPAAGKQEIKVWDVATGQETASIDPQGAFSALAFSADGQALFAAKVVPIELTAWSTATGKRLWTSTLDVRATGQLSMRASPDGRLIACHLIGRAGVWVADAQDGKLLRTLEQPGDPQEQIPELFQNSYSKGFGVSALPSATYGSTLSFSPDSKLLAGASPHGVGLWDAITGQSLLRTEVIARSLAFLADGRTLALAAASKADLHTRGGMTSLALWDVLYQPARVAAEGLVCKTFDPRGRTLVGSVGSSTTLQLRNLADGGVLADLPTSLNHTAFSPDGSRLAGTWVRTEQEIFDIGAATPRVRAASSAETTSLLIHNVPGSRVLLREEHRRQPNGTDLLTFEAIDPESGATLGRFSCEPERVFLGSGEQVRCSPDRKYLTIPFLGAKPGVRIWDLASGKMARELSGQVEVVFAPDSRVAAAYPLTNAFNPNSKAEVKLFEIATGREVATIPVAVVRNVLFPRAGARCAFSRDGSSFAVLADKAIELWDAAKGERIGALEGHTARVAVILLLAGGDLISLDEEGAWKRWDLGAHKEVWAGKQSAGKVTRLVAAPDGKRIATATAEGIRIWDTATGECTVAIPDDRAHLAELEFVGGRRLMSWGSRRLWDVTTGKEPGDYRNSPPRPFLSVCYTSDGKSLIAVAPPPARPDPRATRVWPYQPDETRSLTSLSLPPGAAATVFDAATGKERFRVPARPGPAVFTPDGRFVIDALVAVELGGLPVDVFYLCDQKQVVTELVVTDAATGKVALRIPAPGGNGALVWLPEDGKTLALALPGKELQLWDLDTHKVRGSIPAQRNWNVRLSPDGKVLATVGNQTELWDIATGKPWASLREVVGFPIGFSADGKVLATRITEGGKSELGLWDLHAGRRLPSLGGRWPLIARGVLVSDGSSVFLQPAKPDDALALWDLQRGQISRTFPAGLTASGDTPPSFSPDGRRLTLAGASKPDPRARFPAGSLVDVASGKVERDLPGSVPAVFLAGGRTMLTGWRETPTGGGTARLVETASGRELRAFPGWLEIPGWSSRLLRYLDAQQPLTCPAPDGLTVLHAMAGAVHVYDALTGELKSSFRGEPERLPIQGISLDGKTLSLKMTEWVPGPSPGSLDSRTTLRLWDAVTGEERTPPPGAFDMLDVHTNRRALGGFRTLTRLTLWDTRTGKEEATLEGVARFATGLAWSADGRTVATVARPGAGGQPVPNGGVIQLWDVAGGKERCRFESEPGTVSFSPDGRLLAVTTFNKQVQIREADSGRLRHTLACPGQGMFAEGGRSFVTTDEPGLTVWDLATGRPRWKLPAGEIISNMQVTVDGKGLLTRSSQMSDQRGVRFTLWDLESGRERAGVVTQVGTDTGDTPLSLAWTPDGRAAALMPRDSKSVIVLDLFSGHEQLVLAVPPAPARAAGPGARPDPRQPPLNGQPRLEFVDEGRRLLAALADGRVVVWDTQWPEPPAAVVHTGFWKTEGQEMVQELAAGGTLFFGDPGWDDYDIEADISPAGPGLVGLAVRAQGANALEALLHSAPNGKTGFWMEVGDGPGKDLKCRQEAGEMKQPLTPGRWYRLQVSVRGSLVSMRLDGERLCEDVPPRGRGRVGFVARGTAARFRNVRVAHALRPVLWDGLPALPPPSPAKLAALHVQAGDRLLAADKTDEALAAFRLAVRTDPTDVPALKQAGLLLRRLGQQEEALDYLRRIPYDPQLKSVLQELRRGVIQANLAEYVEGKRKPHDEQEQVILCALCDEGDYPLAAARFYRKLFAEHAWYRGDGGLSDHDPEPHRANAARAAARAGTGQGKDATALSEEERQNWRRQARAWLETELRLHTRQDMATSSNYLNIRLLPSRWQQDPGFDGVRDTALARLPADERKAWEHLWAEVDAWRQMLVALSYGPWQTEPQGLAQNEIVGEAVWLVGNPSWTDVTVEVEIQPRNGEGELGVVVRAQEADEMVRAVLGGWRKTAHGLIALSPGKGGEALAAPSAATLEPNRWYRVRLEAHGQQFRLLVDDKLLQEVREQRFASGRVGLFTLSYVARFRNFKVTDPKGKVLFAGTSPPVPEPAAATLLRQGREQLDAGKFTEAEKTYRTIVEQWSQDGDGHFGLARALHGQGRPTEALPLYFRAVKYYAGEPAAVFNQLGLALEATGHFDASVLAFRKALAISQQFPQASENFRRVEKRRQTLRELHEWETGNRKFARPADLLALALSARDDCQRYVASTRLFTSYLEKVSTGFPADPPLKRRFNGYTEYYEAACSAARAGTGQGDAEGLPAADRAQFRAQALDWLRLELGRYQQAFKDRPVSVAGWLRAFTRHWQLDPDLEAVRSAEALKALPEVERVQWEKLWRDVADLQKQADAAPAGSWRVEGKELVQETSESPCVGLLTFGDTKWQDYTVELETQIGAAGGEVGVLFHAANDHDFMAALLGGWDSRPGIWNVERIQRHAVAAFERDRLQRVTGPVLLGKLDPGRWYRVRLQVRGAKATLFLDGKRVLEAEELPRDQGQVGLRTFQTGARFRNLTVTDSQGNTLFEGLPPVPRVER